MDGRIVVAGGVNIDIKGFAASKIRGEDSNPGSITISAGGVAGNIASGLAALGAPVSLCTVLSDDRWGAFLIDRARERGIDTSPIIIKEGESSGTYLSLLQPTGELFSAVSDMHLLEGLGRQEISPWISQLNGGGSADSGSDIRMLIIDANLPPAILEALIIEAKHKGIPIIAEPVSTTKAPRLILFLDHLTYLTPNEIEYRKILESAGEVGKQGPWPCGFAITRGAEGVKIIPPAAKLSLAQTAVQAAEQTAGRKPPAREPYERPAWPARITDVSGAGDAFTAGFCYALYRGAPMEEAADSGLAMAALNLESPDSVRPDLSAELLARRIEKMRGE
jgi:pseudouridine kinase